MGCVKNNTGTNFCVRIIIYRGGGSNQLPDSLGSEKKTFLDLIPAENKYAVIKGSLQTVRSLSCCYNQIALRMNLTEDKTRDHWIEIKIENSLYRLLVFYLYLLELQATSIIRKLDSTAGFIFHIYFYILYSQYHGEKFMELKW
ncbi:MAG: hypothetical protein IPJ60_18665 [Sphingobacteriaceae bacterium]|nr:hypothetical protein [Sphingobacteriaceae bacterium]